MKRIGNLYEKIISIDNLYLAERKARLGKINKKYIIEFLKNLDCNILDLHLKLLSQTYITGEYYHFYIFEPKKRYISALPYTDRIIHHAIINILEPLFINSFIKETYSCIKFRGILKGLKDLNKCFRDKENTKYALKFDIKKFYPSINHKILKSLLSTKFKDEKLLKLLYNIIESTEGLPLGSYTSQWLANFYLDDFDHWLKQDKRLKYISRYCDDIIILHKSKEFLHILRIEIQNYLKIYLDLALSNYQVFPVKSRGIDYLGYKSYHSHILLRKSIKISMIRTLNSRNKPSFYGWCYHCDSINLQNKYLNFEKTNNKHIQHKSKIEL